MCALFPSSLHPLRCCYSAGHPDYPPYRQKARSYAKLLPLLHALIDYEDPYVQPLILSALEIRLPSSSYTLISSISDLPAITSPLLLVTSYESLPFTHIHTHPTTTFANAYVIRKALIRKHYLAFTLDAYLTKHPNSPLKQHIPATVSFELDYAEFLDDAILEAFELHESFARNKGKKPVAREWWILKPSMSDRGQGVRLFSTEDELQAVFEEWEANNPEDGSEDDEEDDGMEAVRSDMASLAITGSHLPETESPPASVQQAQPTFPAAGTTHGDGIITSQLRHFVAQPYISPLLFPELGNRKFHIRTYVLAVGALKVYVYREMLALFAAEPYVKPGAEPADLDGGRLDMRAHLTNTCLQDGTREGSVLRFWDLPPSVPSPARRVTPSSYAPTSTSADWRTHVFSTICSSTASLFEAASTQPTTFQPLPNAFEIFGVDWMVDERGEAWLLEVNAFPDFRQTGEDLRDVVKGLWEAVVGIAVGDFFGVGERDGQDWGQRKVGDERWGLRKVLDLDMGRG